MQLISIPSLYVYNIQSMQVLKRLHYDFYVTLVVTMA